MSQSEPNILQAGASSSDLYVQLAKHVTNVVGGECSRTFHRFKDASPELEGLSDDTADNSEVFETPESEYKR